MRQDPSAAPYQRASYEQAPALPLPARRNPRHQSSHPQAPYQPPDHHTGYQQAAYQQAGFGEAAYQQAEPAYPAPEYPSYGDYDPAPRFPAHRSDTRQFRSPRFAEPRPWDQPTQPQAEVADSWMPGDGEEAGTALAALRDDQRKANRMKRASLAMAIIGVASFLVCLGWHQLTMRTGLLALVLILAGLVSFRRYAARLAGLRTQEASLLGYPR